jgi:transcription antitermination factor NusA-like protein
LWRAVSRVKAELCSFCLKSGILCPKCSARLKSGDISGVDLKVARLLLSLEVKFPSLQNVFFHRAVDAGRTLAIVVGPGDVPRLLGYGGKIIRAISEETGKSVRVLEFGVDDRRFLEDLFAPLNIVTINTIWLPDGSTETRVILRRRRGSQLPFDLKTLKEIASKIRNITLRVELTD